MIANNNRQELGLTGCSVNLNLSEISVYTPSQATPGHAIPILYLSLMCHICPPPSVSLAALAKWLGDLCHNLCSCHPWLWTYRNHQQLPYPDQVIATLVENTEDSESLSLENQQFPLSSKMCFMMSIAMWDLQVRNSHVVQWPSCSGKPPCQRCLSPSTERGWHEHPR